MANAALARARCWKEVAVTAAEQGRAPLTHPRAVGRIQRADKTRQTRSNNAPAFTGTQGRPPTMPPSISCHSQAATGRQTDPKSILREGLCFKLPKYCSEFGTELALPQVLDTGTHPCLSFTYSQRISLGTPCLGQNQACAAGQARPHSSCSLRGCYRTHVIF